MTLDKIDKKKFIEEGILVNKGIRGEVRERIESRREHKKVLRSIFEKEKHNFETRAVKQVARIEVRRKLGITQVKKRVKTSQAKARKVLLGLARS